MVNDILQKLKQEMNSYPLPGKNENIFNQFFVPKILQMNGKVPENISRDKLLELKSSEDGMRAFNKIIKFFAALQKTYTRPFPPLGSTLASYGKEIMSWLMQRNQPLESFFDKLTAKLFHGNNLSLFDLIAAGSYCCNVIREPFLQRTRQNCTFNDYFETGDKIEHFQNPCLKNGSKTCCNMYRNVTIDEHFGTFLDIMKHSISSNFRDKQDLSTFYENLAEKILKNNGLMLTNASQENFNNFLFCDLVSDFPKSGMWCQKMFPVVTGNGLCHSFNSLPATVLYKNSDYSKVWISTFGDKVNSSLDFPSVWGPSRPLYIVVQSFEPSPTRDGKNFLLSFTNEFNPYDVTHDSFEIMPGYQHTFRVIPSHLTTSTRFDELRLDKRGCQLKSETDKVSLLYNYSKSGCEFECALKASYDACNCIPWSAPRNLSHSKTCDMLGNLCFKTLFNSPQAYANCDCLNDCQSTTFAISESGRPLGWRDTCQVNVIKKFVHFVQQRYGIYFSWEFFSSDNNPDPDSDNAMCEYLVQNHISIIKVEMGTKSVIKSVRDVRTTFEFQLSAVGKTSF